MVVVDLFVKSMSVGVVTPHTMNEVAPLFVNDEAIVDERLASNDLSTVTCWADVILEHPVESFLTVRYA